MLEPSRLKQSWQACRASPYVQSISSFSVIPKCSKGSMHRNMMLYCILTHMFGVSLFLHAAPPPSIFRWPIHFEWPCQGSPEGSNRARPSQHTQSRWKGFHDSSLASAIESWRGRWASQFQSSLHFGAIHNGSGVSISRSHSNSVDGCTSSRSRAKHFRIAAGNEFGSSGCATPMRKEMYRIL